MKRGYKGSPCIQLKLLLISTAWLPRLGGSFRSFLYQMVLVHRERGSGAGKGKETEVDGDMRPVFQEKEKNEGPMLGWLDN